MPLKKTYFFILTYLLLIPNLAFAYLDPGSGSMLIYFIIGIFSALIYSIKEFFYKIIARLTSGKINRSLQKITSANILFYAEGGQYWQVFAPVIKALTNKKVPCVYYTSDKLDAGLNADFPNYKAFYIGNIQNSLALLNNIEVPIVVTTTPQLEVIDFKRSKKVKRYIHLIHAPTDALNYKPFAFDYYDVVMCSGQHQIDNIRLLEQARKTKIKKLLATGLTYFDDLINNKIECAKSTEITVLVAPTWGKDGLLHKQRFAVIETLLKNNFNVIIRPHPQSYISEPLLITEITANASNHNNVIIDDNNSAKESMTKADIMLSDISGAIFDFAFVYEKPVIAIKGDISADRLYEINDINRHTKQDNTIWEIATIQDIATLIDADDLHKLPELINTTLTNKTTNQKINKIRDSAIFNYGTAGEAAATQLINISQGIK